MQMRQFRSHFGQPHLTWSELVTRSTTELLEALSPSPLRGRALILRHLGDNAHRLQRGNASFKPLCPFLALGREAKLALTADRKSTRLNSSHRCISYAVFCLKKTTKK